jgi:signal peptidase I
MTTETLEYASPARPTGGAGASRRGKRALAVAASIFVPGLGQIIAGERRRGLKWLATYIAAFAIIFATCVLPRLTPLLVVIVPLNFSIQLACFVDAYRVGHRSSRAMLGGPGRRYLVAVALLLATMFANPLFVGMLLTQRFAETFEQPTAGMSPTLQPGDRFICHKLGEPRRWDVVVFLAPDMGDGDGRQKFVMRLVGLPGEQVEMFQGAIYIDGKPIPRSPGSAPYQSTLPREVDNRGAAGNGTQGHPIRLAADEYYFLGDNSPISGDSRYWPAGAPNHQPGTVGRADIIGRATYIYWPPSRWRSLEPQVSRP